MPARKRKTWRGRIYLGRGASGEQRFHYVGRFATKRERDNAVARARTQRPWDVAPASELTGDRLADTYLAEIERRVQDRTRKASSLGTVRGALKPFRAQYADRLVTTITRPEAKAWMPTVPAAYRPVIVTLGNYAVDELEAIERNPFRGLAAYRSRGRADRPLPDLEAVLDATAALGDYGPQMAALILTGALTGMRPGELYELRWSDVDLARNRVTVSRRVYHGIVDTPKNGRTKTIALPPRARDALLAQAAEHFAQDPHRRPGDLVFVSKQGRPLTPQKVSAYWSAVRAGAGLDAGTDFYLATKHVGVNLLWKQGVSTRAIAAQMGWSERAVDQLLRVYGHKDIAALEEIDALYAGESDPPVTQNAPNRPPHKD